MNTQQPPKPMRHRIHWIVLTTSLTVSVPGYGSSHREAPLITSTPKVDATDFYLFNSYEPGREGYVVMIADYLPLQDAYGGPNYFPLDPNAVYEIHVDNNGDAVEDLTFQFHFQNAYRNIALGIGPENDRRTNTVPVLAVGPISAADQSALNLDQTYTLNLIRGPRRMGAPIALTNAADGLTVFTKPEDNVGTKTIPDYDSYANAYIYEFTIPDTTNRGKVFVGQRKDPFVVNLGETFDLVNISTSPLGPEDANKDSLADKNVTSLVLELPRSALLSNLEQPIIGAWTTASRIDGTNLTQLSRLGMPLVNEVVIGLNEKDKFNGSEPKDDLANFADYVTHPTLPAILELLFGSAGVQAPTLFPRSDLVAAFVTGVDGLNKNGAAGEMQRLNTGVPATPRDEQKNLGVIAGYSLGQLDVDQADLAGFPNGRRPGDDVVDIALRVVMGKLLTPDVAPSGDLPFTDGATVNARMFPASFPYLNSPLPGSPNEPTITITPQTAAGVTDKFQSVAGTYDPQTRRLSVPRPEGSAGFLRLKSDRAVQLADPGVTADSIDATIR